MLETEEAGHDEEVLDEGELRQEVVILDEDQENEQNQENQHILLTEEIDMMEEEPVSIVTDMPIHGGEETVTIMSEIPYVEGEEPVTMVTEMVMQEGEECVDMVTEVVLEEGGIMGTEEVILGTSEDEELVMMDQDDVTLGEQYFIEGLSSVYPRDLNQDLIGSRPLNYSKFTVQLCITM